MSAQPVQPRQPQARSPADRRLLIVEPDELICWSLRSYLRRWYHVRAWSNAVQAERSLRHRPVHALVISDHVSPSETAQLVSLARDRNPDVRVLIVGQAGDGESATNGVWRIGKPFELHDLARVLDLRFESGEST